jgi:hypothetical protein
MKQLLITSFIFLTVSTYSSAQNDEGFIYGTITTIDDNKYTGAIRWGKEEVFWTDFFNATKIENKNLKYISDSDSEDIEDQVVYHDRDHDESWAKKWWSGSWGGKYEAIHQWVCQFGELESLEITGREKVEITLKDGKRWKLGGGSNDIGTKIKIMTDDIGAIELNWDRIEDVQFSKTPSKLKNKFGEPLYGTVETHQGAFTGFVQWDHDERLTSDALDGESDDGDFSIKFEKIKAITKDGRGSSVTLKSGRTLYLDGTNDVNDENRGIIVTLKGVGRVDIPWDEFEKVTFEENVRRSGPTYNDFPSPKPLNGRVETEDGRIFSGRIIYDLDEELDIEIIQGKDDEIEYLIPLRNIKSIKPKNYSYSTVTLRNGDSILIGEGQDVSDKNDGLLIFTSEDAEPAFVSWDDLQEVTFN